jgi:hypothetical protein
MFARKLSINLKPNTLAEFSKTFDQEIIPLLRKQKGFKDEIIFAAPGATDILAISLWDTKQILKILDTVIVGSPKVWATEVLSSTFHEIAAAVPVVA